MNKRKLKTIESFFKKKDKVNEVVQGQDVHVLDDPCSESELDEVAAWIAEFGTEEEEQEEAPSQSLHTVTGQDIVNAMDDVATTKKLIQNLRDHGWSSLISDVTSFCKKQDIAIPDLNAFYADYIRSHAQNELTVEHHYRYDIFTVAVDQQLHELNSRFSEQATELLVLCASLDPKDSFSSLKIDDVCLLASKFYPADFSEQEMVNLRHQLQHYELYVPTNPRFQNLSNIADLCRRLEETGKSDDYYLIDRLYNTYYSHF